LSTKITRDKRDEIKEALESGKVVIIHPDSSKKFSGKVLTIDYPEKPGG